MQGREAKHVLIAAYAKHSHTRNRWQMIFRHDYIRNIWLPLQNPSLLVYHHSKESVVPDEVVTDSSNCSFCFLRKSSPTDKCFYCDHDILSEIVKSVAAGKIAKKLAALPC